MIADDLTALWALQRLDSELDTLRVKVAEIPRKIEGLRLTVSEEKRQLEDARHQVVELKKKSKLAEVDVKELDLEIARKSGQMYSAKTNELMKMMLREVEAMQQSKRKIEDGIVEIMEQLEQLDGRIKHLEKEVVGIEAETTERIAVLEREGKDLAAAVAAREAERNQLAAAMDRSLTGIYERIRRSKNGIAVVSVANNRCNGCINPLPPQKMLEVSRKDKLYYCEHCGRILVPIDII